LATLSDKNILANLLFAKAFYISVKGTLFAILLNLSPSSAKNSFFNLKSKWLKKNVKAFLKRFVKDYFIVIYPIYPLLPFMYRASLFIL